MSPSFSTGVASTPVSSATSRRAVSWARSPGPISPFGRAQVPSGFPAGRIAASTGRPRSCRTTTTPAENSWRTGSPYRDGCAEGHQPGESPDRGVAHPDAAVRDASGEEPRGVRPVDPDDAAARPVGQPRRARVRAEGDRTVEGIREVLEPNPDVELAGRGRP